MNWYAFDTFLRGRLLSEALRYSMPNAYPEAVSDTAAVMLRAHMEEVPSQQIVQLRSDPIRFPLEIWLPHVSAAHATWLARQLPGLPASQADKTAVALSAKGVTINVATLNFILQRVSLEVQVTIFDRLLTSTSAARRGQALGVLGLGGRPATAKALETLLELEMAHTPLELSRLRVAGQFLLARRPSEKLFPVARLLLASKARKDITAGIAIADSLGREDLLPALRPHLGSMDAHVRVTAKKAVASIQAIAAIKAGAPVK
jgi:hypothetical protein